MNREDLGEMLEKQVGSWARHGDVAGRDREDIDDIFRWAAEAFWNDAIDALKKDYYQYVQEGQWAMHGWVSDWLEDQKIGDDE